MNRTASRLVATLGVLGLSSVALAGCTDNTPNAAAGGAGTTGPGPLQVVATDTECGVSAKEAP